LCVGQAFMIRLDSDCIYELLLDKVLELGDVLIPDGRRPFSLEFTNQRKDAYLPQQIYTLEHITLGVLDLFIVPLGPDGIGMRYEVVFN
jgi:hypothetical protein